MSKQDHVRVAVVTGFYRARSYTRDALVGLAFGAAIIASMFIIGHLPAIYTFIFGGQ